MAALQNRRLHPVAHPMTVVMFRDMIKVTHSIYHWACNK